MINSKLALPECNNLMTDAAFRAIPHFIGRMPPGYPFVAKILWIGKLILVQFLQNLLFFTGGLLHTPVEFKLRSIPDFGPAEFSGASPPGGIMGLFSAWIQ